MSDNFDFDKTLRGHIPGERVFDRYKLVKTLGQGGMGVVWLAFDEQLERNVALKFLPEELAHDPSAINDLKRETKKALKLTHPNIVRIYDFLQNDQMVAVSMEHVDGQSLTQIRLEEPEQVFSTEKIENWVGQICQALDYAHTKEEIAHRDLKPSNLLIDKKGNLKITDFGISATISDATTHTQLNASSSGTPRYASPEQMMGGKAAPTDDIYSLGATIYELLTSKPPFYTGTIYIQLRDVIPPSMKERRKELDVKTTDTISKEWESTIAACLEKEAQDRPQSLTEVWDGLHGKGSIKPITTSSQKSGSGKKWMLVCCLLILVGGAGASGWYYGIGGFDKKPTPDVTPDSEVVPPIVAPDKDPTENPEEEIKKTPTAQEDIVSQNESQDKELEQSSSERENPDQAIDVDPIKDDVPQLEKPPVIPQEKEKEDISTILEDTPKDTGKPPSVVEQSPKEEIIFPETGPQPDNDWVVPNYNIEMVWIAPGKFMMGERSLHLVSITQGFWLGTYEVTRDQWESIMGYNPSKLIGVSGNVPIDQVSWNDAMNFCSILTEIEHDAGRLPKDYEYTLPTEAQWEYACKAGQNTFFSFGNRIDATQANFNGKQPYGGGKKGVYREKPLPVGSFSPNGWGLYDMHGNIREWCYDWNGKYSLRDTVDPTGPKKGKGHITRGGAWFSSGEECMAGARDYENPNSQNSYLGFRLALRKINKK